MNVAALEKLVRITLRNEGSFCAADRIGVYESLGELLPTEVAREEAKHVAWVMREAEKCQLDFSSKLFPTTGKPSHDGNGKDGQ